MADVMERPIARVLDINEKQPVSYCIDLWLRDMQIQASIARVKGRVSKDHVITDEPIAIVGYGPSLNETWHLLKDFKVIMTCSGAHKFLIERGIIPTYHLDVDPRAHKAALIGTPHPDVQYLMASTCHPAVFDLLEGFNVKLWHIFDSAEEGIRILPSGEWAMTGGSGAGLRAMAMARLLGHVNQHVFGIDGSEGTTGKHAGPHPSQAKKQFTTEYQGTTYLTTPAFLECAKAVFHELDAMPDVNATFYGEGLVQHMAQYYVRGQKIAQPNLAIEKPVLISEELRELNARLHRENLLFGVGGAKHAETVLKLSEQLKTTSILDYGCGKGRLAKALPFPIWEYDPAIPGKDEAPRAADIVICTDVLEHVEDGKVQYVLGDIRRCLKKVGYFVIHLGPAAKTYADGRNTHLIQRSASWWETKVAKFFDVAKVIKKGRELHLVVGPHRDAKMAAPAVLKKLLAVPERPVLSLANLVTHHDPYVTGTATDVLTPEMYAALAATFPPVSECAAFGGQENKKYALSENKNPAGFKAFLLRQQVWRQLHDAIKAPAFIAQTFALLRAKGFPLPDDCVDPAHFSSRFECSLIPADGGCLLPHTDIPSKVVTIVLGMRDEPWDDAWGGGTDLLRPKPDIEIAFEDYKAPLSAFDVVRTVPYAANQALVFVKTAESWHAVGPLTGPADAMRRTITINIERRKP